MQNERTLKMKQEYVSLHDQGLSPKEIAKRFNLSQKTIYNCLDDIAKESGRSRASLLERNSSTHLTHDRQFEPVAEINVEEYSKKFTELKEQTRELSRSIGKQILVLKKEGIQ